MGEARIGRVFVAGLHQAIADIAPTRLEFYENWLNSAGLRHGTIGLAAMTGVLGFLRREETYALISARAGTYAANWTVASLTPARRALLRFLPESMRARYAVRLARDMIRRTYAGTPTSVKWRRGQALLEIRGSLFCTVREPAAAPLCEFYAEGVRRFFELLRIRATVAIPHCRALGHRSCGLAIVLPPKPAGAEDEPSKLSAESMSEADVTTPAPERELVGKTDDA
jgi:hypothetical protein